MIELSNEQINSVSGGMSLLGGIISPFPGSLDVIARGPAYGYAWETAGGWGWNSPIGEMFVSISYHVRAMLGEDINFSAW